jgi:ribonuclease E
MEKQEFKSKWDELARDLGADISPEIEQREQAMSTPMSESAPRPADHGGTVAPPLPKRAAADWDKLAGELGLPPGEPSPPPAPVRTEEHRPASRSTATPVGDVSRPPAPERQHREQRETRDLQHQRPPRRESREGRAESHGKHRERPRHPRDRREPRERPPLSAESEPETMLEADAPPVAPPPEPAKPAAVSLWHKIFGASTEQTTKFSDAQEAAAEPYADSQIREEPLAESAEEIRSFSGTEVQAAGFVGDLVRDDESSDDADDEAVRERKRGRPRRRRRGGRGRRSERQSDSQQPATHAREPNRDALSIGDDFDDLNIAEPSDTDTDNAFDGAFGEDANSDGEHLVETDNDRSKAAQRTIPSWEEAIGFIVDSNMQNRSQRRPPTRGNSPRGRSRGRRKNPDR